MSTINLTMRKLLLICALMAVTVPAVALAGKRAPGDGTLQVRDGSGHVTINARGGLIGRCGRCEVLIDDFGADIALPVVFGADVKRQVGETAMRYVNRAGTDDMRFRISGRNKVVIKGSDINVSVVGTGVVFLNGIAGEFAFDGEAFQPLPETRTRFQLGVPANAGG